MARNDNGYNKSVKPRRSFATETPYSQADERVSWRKKFENPEKYIKEKLRMLRQDMYIEPTEEEIDRLKSKKTESEIDNVVRGIVARAWS